jgi:hypothetical protein
MDFNQIKIKICLLFSPFIHSEIKYNFVGSNSAVWNFERSFFFMCSGMFQRSNRRAVSAQVAEGLKS